ncbi:beta-Ala-His dipeptidase-like [Gastrophryne carolinensis]
MEQKTTLCVCGKPQGIMDIVQPSPEETKSCFQLILISQLVMLPFTTDASEKLIEDLFQYIDANQDDFVQALKEWIAVPSDSSDPQLRGDLIRMVEVTAQRIKKLGATVQLVDMGFETLRDDKKIKFPPAILAELGNDTSKATVCFYGHVDVQPAKKEDGWKTDPYTMTEVNGNLYGRGATDNKGPVLAWINAIDTYIALKKEITVNLKFIIEGVEETGSPGLEDLIKDHEDFFSNVDYVVISDNVWVSRKPALTYGTRGNAYFLIEVESGKKDLHSGTFGGIIHEAMRDLVHLLAKLQDSTGHILIPGIYDDVAPLTEEEKRLYENIEFDMEDLKNSTEVSTFMYSTEEEILQHMWRYPTLSIHGIEGAFAGTGTKTVIPCNVIGKFSIRQVPNMQIPVVEKLVKNYLEDEFAKLKSPNKLKVKLEIGAMPWVANVDDPQYKAAKIAIKRVFGVTPDMIRDGSTIPLARIFQDLTKKKVMMLPIGGADDGEHSQNEKISRSNYIQGTKVFATFFLELAKLHEELLTKTNPKKYSPGVKLPLPPVILAQIGNDINKPTVCFYGHVDVQPAKKEDGWASDPYTVREENGNFYGRGASDDKGPALAMLNAVESAVKTDLPVNVKIVIEGMEEVGSQGLEKLLEDKKDTFFADVDYTVLTDTPWLSKRPGITYGARGDCYFTLEVEGAARDLHSGDFGGTVYEAMNDVIYLLGQLEDVNGKILVPGVYDDVLPMTDQEKELYKNVEFSLDNMMADIGVKKLLHDTKEELLMYRWRYPSLSIHGIEGAFCGSGTKTVIPAKVIGKFSMRQAPDMNPAVIEKQVTDYLESKFMERKSPNKMKVSMVIGAKPWLANINDPIFAAARKAVKKAFDVDADMIRTGATIPIARTFEEVVGPSVMLFGIGSPDDSLHGQNEKISKVNYIGGTKAYATFLQEIPSV